MKRLPAGLASRAGLRRESAVTVGGWVSGVRGEGEEP